MPSFVASLEVSSSLKLRLGQLLYQNPHLRIYASARLAANQKALEMGQEDQVADLDQALEEVEAEGHPEARLDLEVHPVLLHLYLGLDQVLDPVLLDHRHLVPGYRRGPAARHCRSLARRAGPKIRPQSCYLLLSHGASIQCL